MNISTQVLADRTCLSLEGEMTIYHATELKSALCSLLAEGRACKLMLNAVTALDTTGVQLLAMTRRDAAAGGLDFTMCSPSAAVVEVLTLLHLLGWCDENAAEGADIVLPVTAAKKRSRRARK